MTEFDLLKLFEQTFLMPGEILLRIYFVLWDSIILFLHCWQMFWLKALKKPRPPRIKDVYGRLIIKIIINGFSK